MADAGSVIKKGVTIELEGKVYRVEDFQHVKPGKGAAFIRTKLKDIINGGVIEKSFRPAENVDTAHVDRSEKQYLYSDDDFYYFMDTATYEQVELSVEDVGDTLKFVKENENVQMLSYNGNIFAVEPPLFVELEIIDTEPGFKGNTATGTYKPATVETGSQVMVPLFVNQGDRIKIDTRTGEYLSRV
ncbi:MAG: elongation factor P [Clostridiales bacterium]|nr:elongation factor P [Clostridiales bacterium]